jgi:hypothetical protein
VVRVHRGPPTDYRCGPPMLASAPMDEAFLRAVIEAELGDTISLKNFQGITLANVRSKLVRPYAIKVEPKDPDAEISFAGHHRLGGWPIPTVDLASREAWQTWMRSYYATMHFETTDADVTPRTMWVVLHERTDPQQGHLVAYDPEQPDHMPWAVVDHVASSRESGSFPAWFCDYLLVVVAATFREAVESM